MSPPARTGVHDLAHSRGFLAVASDGALGEVEMPLVPSGEQEPDFLVVRIGRFPRVRHPVIPTALVVDLDPHRRRVYLRGRADELADLDEHVPLAV